MPRKIAITKTVLARVTLALAVVLATSGAAHAQGDLDVVDVIDTLTVRLDLTGDQPAQVKGLLTTFATDWSATLDKYDGVEDEDAKKQMVDDLKAVQKTYLDGLGSVLSEQQMETYDQLVDQFLHALFDEVAESKLRDLQPQLDLTENQVMQIKPIMGTALVDVVQLMWDNADKRMGIMRKLKLSNELKKIQNTANSQIGKILTPDQQTKWEAIKQAAKDQKDAAKSDSGG
jgi:hypothetical protein